jgi:hypothetical protein
VVGTPYMRLTIIISRALVDDFRPIAARNERTVSAEVRQMVAEAVERDLIQRAARRRAA